MQAASAIESFKMESPVKKLDFSASDKENAPFDADLAILEAEIDAKHQQSSTPAKEEPKPAVAPTIKPDEADEPLLQENPQRFVLFPIKYHEVRDQTRPGRVKWNVC
jgi:ribonucleoside-diphosphate reductase subunit M2